MQKPSHSIAVRSGLRKNRGDRNMPKLPAPWGCWCGYDTQPETLSGASLLMSRAYNIAAKSLGETHPTTIDMKTALNGMMMKSAPPQTN
jgi:hypothetical protein